jgi:tetratricopeptide (TPR) repeat protein
MVKMWLAILAVLIGSGLSHAADNHSPLTTDKRWEQARSYLAQGNAAAAAALFHDLAKDYPKVADVQLFLGMSKLRLRDPQAAVIAAKRAIALEPQHIDARTFLAWIELEVRADADAAIEEYGKIIELRPELPEAYSNLAVAQKRKGDLERALATINRALELKPNFASALTTRGAILSEQGKWVAARADFEAALRLDPRDDGALYGLSQALRESKDYAGAQRSLRELIARSPNFVYWLEWGRIGMIRYWWILLTVALAFGLRAQFRKSRMQANG